MFSSVSHSKGYAVDIITESLVLANESKVHLQWNPQLIFPFLTANDSIDIKMFELDTELEEWKEVHILVSATSNDGEEETMIVFTSKNSTPIAVFVSVAYSNSNPIQNRLEENELRPGIWSAIFYYTETNGSSLACTAWYSSEPNDIGKKILQSVVPCPPTEQQASQLCNSGVTLENYISIFGNTLYDEQRRNYFHPSAAACYKQPIINES